MEAGVHLYAPAPQSAQLRPGHCPTCTKPRWFLLLTYEWHGPELTCLRCGDRWGEDGRAERPFARAWRREAVRQARITARRRKARLTWAPIRWRESA